MPCLYMEHRTQTTVLSNLAKAIMGMGEHLRFSKVNLGELQLKGSGPTPFCRGADGRAVLRSSVREFLASEAMNNMRVSTTRALSLVVSKTIPCYALGIPRHTHVRCKMSKFPTLTIRDYTGIQWRFGSN